jgi:hypothetical protein
MATVNGKNGGSEILQNGKSTSDSKTNGKRRNGINDNNESKKSRQLEPETNETSKPKKQWIINAFAMQAPCHLNPGLFKYPGDKGRQYNSIKNWISLAQKLEAAKFHAIFFADVLGGYDVYKGPANLTPTIPAASQFPINDPLYAVAASKYFGRRCGIWNQGG